MEDESMPDPGETMKPVMISALEHFSYCPRQCALIHIEHTFDENIYTLRGQHAHERVDLAATRAERGMRVERALPIWSRRLGLVGRADVVEFHDGRPYPIEYKVGAQREWKHELIQLCAEAMCLEEMLEAAVPAGAVYYCASRTRREVTFSEEMRVEVELATRAVREMLEDARLPLALHDRRCEKCSLVESCLPAVVMRPSRLRAYRMQVFSVEEM